MYMQYDEVHLKTVHDVPIYGRIAGEVHLKIVHDVPNYGRIAGLQLFHLHVSFYIRF